MMVSTKGRYALRVLIDLAEHQTDGYIPLKDTAARQEISEKYLEGIIKVLVKAKLLEGVRGKGGGYRLTKAPEQYTVGSILRLMFVELCFFLICCRVAIHQCCGKSIRISCFL